MPLLRLLLPLALLGALLGAPAAVHADVGADVLAALKRGLKSKSPELKAKAVLDVGRFAGRLSPAQKKTAAAQLNKAFDRESETEIRRTMVRALALLKTENGWVPVINAALTDRDPKVRSTARLEVFGGRGDLLEVMQGFIRQEKSASYRARLVLLLGDRRKPDAVPYLADLLGDKKRLVVAAAAEALEAITGQAFGFDGAKYKLWHARWMKSLPKDGETGPSVAPTEGPGKEPEPHVTRSLHPDFYGLKIRSKDVVFVIDISGSVGSGGVGRAKQELVQAVELLGSDVHVSALFFSDKIEYWQKGQMVPATPENKENLVFFLRGLDPGKRTDVFTAFNAGLRILDKRATHLAEQGIERKEPATLIAVSDGQDNMKRVPLHVIEERLDRLDLERTVVHSIVLGGKPSKLMQMLAYYGSGKYIVVPRD